MPAVLTAQLIGATRSAKPAIGRRLAAMSRQTGLIDIQVAMEADNVFSVVGKIDAVRFMNCVAPPTTAERA
jgi:hypothetical protein